MDRAYFSYELFKTLNDKNIKFVIRVRNNCQHLQKYLNENKEKNCKENHKPKKQKNGEENHKPKKQKNGEENHKPKKQKINQKLKNVRFITYNATVKETKRNKQKEEVSILRQLECNIATNLNTTISDESIKEMYTSRWDIEIFFKLIKRNFSFSYLTEHNKNTVDCYKKKYTVILILCILERIFELTLNEKIKTHDKYNIKYNKTLAINGIKKILPNIIDSTLTENTLESLYKNYYKTIYSEKNISNPRVSKQPFTKWYVKAYSDYYKYAKILDCITNDTLDQLNKNLKLEASYITILK